MKYRLILLAATWLLVDPSWLPAQVYRYTDPSGAVHYTDNLMNVPESQRGQYATETSPNPAAPAPPVSREPSPDNPEPVEQPERIPDLPDGSDPLAEMERLQQVKAAMDQEYAGLLTEQLALAEQKKSLSDTAGIDAFNRKVMEVNTRVDAYEKKRAVFEIERDRFQRFIQGRMGQPTGKAPETPPGD